MLQVNQQDCTRENAGDAKCSQPAQKSKEQHQWTQALRKNPQNARQVGNPEAVKVAQGATPAVTAKESEGFLQSVREDQQCQGEKPSNLMLLNRLHRKPEG